MPPEMFGTAGSSLPVSPERPTTGRRASCFLRKRRRTPVDDWPNLCDNHPFVLIPFCFTLIESP